MLSCWGKKKDMPHSGSCGSLASHQCRRSSVIMHLLRVVHMSFLRDAHVERVGIPSFLCIRNMIVHILWKTVLPSPMQQLFEYGCCRHPKTVSLFLHPHPHPPLPYLHHFGNFSVRSFLLVMCYGNPWANVQKAHLLMQGVWLCFLSVDVVLCCMSPCCSWRPSDSHGPPFGHHGECCRKGCGNILLGEQ